MNEEKKNDRLELKNPTVYQTNENCQVFNGPISGCVFAMPGSTVNHTATQQVDGGQTKEPTTRPQLDKEELPEVLRTEAAEKLIGTLVDEHLLNDDWQPQGISGTERALVAKVLSERLGINDVWQVFGRLWNVKPETLRASFNKALEQRKSLKFQEKLKKILR